MEGGKLRHTITIQSPTGSRDSYGERTTSWTNVKDVRAEIRPVSAGEQYSAFQSHGNITHRVTIRYDAALASMDASWRVLFNSRALVLVAPPRNIDERSRRWELLCNEGLREE